MRYFGLLVFGFFTPAVTTGVFLLAGLTGAGLGVW